MVSNTDSHAAGQKSTETWWREVSKLEMCGYGWVGGLPVPPSRAPLPAMAHGCSRLDAAELCLSPPPQLWSDSGAWWGRHSCHLPS